VLVLTHHNGLLYDGKKKQTLWDQVCGALGKPPEVWYWGHIHNGIVYSSQSQAGSDTGARLLSTPYFSVVYGRKGRDRRPVRPPPFQSCGLFQGPAVSGLKPRAVSLRAFGAFRCEERSKQ
jgi:hypothetical protein